MTTVIPVRKLPGFLILIFILTSCRVMLVPEYNAALEDQIANAAKATDKLYIDIMDTPFDERTYTSFNTRYNDIEAEINSIQLKNEARPKNGDFLVIIKNLKDAFAEAKKYHKEHKLLTEGEAIAYQATLAGYWKPLYISEKSLK
jgi:hypothetical protein